MKYTFNVPDMSCNHCKMRIEKTMGDSGKVENLEIDLDSKKVSMESELTADAIIELFDEAGYDAKKI
jgi:copper chaperone